jgi:hypothetical protein
MCGSILNDSKLAELSRKDNNQKGLGDFSPPDPVECPAECPYLQEDGSCSYISTLFPAITQRMAEPTGRRCT